jgi:hypothetical protein
MNQMPLNVTENDLMQRTQSFEIYAQQFIFDQSHRIIGKFENNQINSSHEAPVKLTLEECLERSKNTEILQDQNAYACSKCKSP